MRKELVFNEMKTMKVLCNVANKNCLYYNKGSGGDSRTFNCF